MKLSTQQVKDALHIGDKKIANLLAEGKLIPVNSPKPGAKKFFRKFDSMAVNKLRTELRANGHFETLHSPARSENSSPKPLEGIMTRLMRLEEKIDKLVRLWS